MTQSGKFVPAASSIWKQEEVIPNYEGLCLVSTFGLLYVMYTWFDVDGEREWEIINEGTYINNEALDKFMKKKKGQ